MSDALRDVFFFFSNFLFLFIFEGGSDRGCRPLRGCAGEPFGSHQVSQLPCPMLLSFGLASAKEVGQAGRRACFFAWHGRLPN